MAAVAAPAAGVHMYLTLLSEGMSFTLYNIITPWGVMPVHSTEKAPTVGLLDNGEKALTEDAQKCCTRKGFLVATSGDELVYVTQLHSGCIERCKGMEEEFSYAESDGKDGTILRLLIWPSANTSASIFETRGSKGSSCGSESATGVVYGWTAGEEDLNGDESVGRFLRENGAAARSTEDVEKDEASVATKFSGLAGEYKRRAKFLEAKYEEKVGVVQKVEEASSWLHGELKELTNIADNIIPEINHDVHEENEKLKAELDAMRKEIDTRMERIEELMDGRTKLECRTVHKGALEINSLELENRIRKASDHAIMLHEIQKKEMEAIYSKLIQLEKQLEQRQALESTIRQLNMKLQAGEKLRKEDRQHLYNIMISLRKNLDQEQERLENSCVDLMNRERMNTEELQENRQELIKGLENMTISGRTVIGIKRMGERDEEPFHLACKRKYMDDDPEGRATRLVSSWQDELKKPSWHPFTVIRVDGEDKEVVDEDDPKLRELQTEYGDNVCEGRTGRAQRVQSSGTACRDLWHMGHSTVACLASRGVL